METEVLNATHPHDPRADELDYAHVADLVRYFLGREYRAFWDRSTFAIFHDGEIYRGKDDVLCWSTKDDEETVLRRAGAWPDEPAPPRFVNIRDHVMRGDERICVARSNTTAKRIAAALNWYKPGRRGS
jgi:hypothetical protein